MGNASSGSRGSPAGATSVGVKEEDLKTAAVTSASTEKLTQGASTASTSRAEATGAEHVASAANEEAPSTATGTQSPNREPAGGLAASNDWEGFLRRRLPHLSKQDLAQWGQVTTAGIIAGNLYGGMKEAMATHAEFLHRFRETPTRVSQRDLMEKRLVRIVGGTVRGGVQLGLLAGIFSGTQIVTAVTMRGGVQDWWTTVAAGGVAAGAMGLVGRGAPSIRLQRSFTLSCTGAIIALPLGLLQDSLRSLLPEEKMEQVPLPRPLPSEEIAAAIERLESRMLSRTTAEEQDRSQ